MKLNLVPSEKTTIRPEWASLICSHPSHCPPMLVYVPEGKSYTHTCPGCGKSFTIRGSGIRF